jgi:protein gp37
MAGHENEWSDRPWNPVTGCTPISPGCQNCYARDTHRANARWGQVKYQHPWGDIWCHPDVLEEPGEWPRNPKSRKLVFVCSMSDLFHRDVPTDFIRQVFNTITRFPRYTFVVLTKRSGRLAHFAAGNGWPDNVWAGVSIENRAVLHRLDDLRRVPAPVRLLHAEPLLESLGEVNLDGIGWVVCGGESGRNARPWDDDWARGVRDQAVAARLPFFFKQGRRPRRGDHALPILDGRTWNEEPA